MAIPGVATESTVRMDGMNNFDVPIGTVVGDADTQEIVGEILEDGQEWVMVPGGRGGLGNDHFKSPTNQTPRYAQPGEDGQELWRILELKLLADVGSGRVSQRGQVHAAQCGERGQARDRRLPFHHVEAEPGHGRVPGDTGLMMADIPGHHRGRPRRAGVGTAVPAPHRAQCGAALHGARRFRGHRRSLPHTTRELEQYNPELLQKARRTGCQQNAICSTTNFARWSARNWATCDTITSAPSPAKGGWTMTCCGGRSRVVRLRIHSVPSRGTINAHGTTTRARHW